MTDSSDSPELSIYSRILRIPEEILQPDAYELLGLPRFEADVGTIKKAAMDRNHLLQRKQNAENYQDVKRIEREVAAALVRLTNPKSKAEYDAKLAERNPQGNSTPRQPATRGSTANDNKTGMEKPTQARPGETPWSAATLKKAAVIGGGFVLLVVLGVAAWIAGRS